MFTKKLDTYFYDKINYLFNSVNLNGSDLICTILRKANLDVGMLLKIKNITV